MTLSEIIKERAGMFKTKKRTSGEAYMIYTGKDRDTIREWHGTDMLPNDWRYDKIHSILSNLTGYNIESMRDIDECRHEIVDGLVDCYNSDLSDWLASHGTRHAYVDQAVQDGLTYGKEVFKSLMCGQYLEIDELFGNIYSWRENQEVDET